MIEVVPLQGRPPKMPSTAVVMERAEGENFAVAARLLSREHREGLLAVYGFARLADELGDVYAGDRLAALDWLEGELDRAYAGEACEPLLLKLQRVLAERELPREPFVRLIDANRMDQRVRRYDTWEQLEGYCELSANPVGELVLAVFGLANPKRIELSDRVCTALQLVEHLQDVSEDLARGRIYLPERDLARFGCSHEQLEQIGRDGLDLPVPDANQAPGGKDSPRARLREAVAYECARVRELLVVGPALVGSVPGRAKLAVAGFVAGGEAAVKEIERAGGEVLGGVPQASGLRRGGALGGVLWRSRGARAATGLGGR